MAQITLLGATGAIGDNTLAVLKQHPNEFQIFALTAHRNVAKMAVLCQEWHPRYAVMADEQAAEALQQRLANSTAAQTEVLAGTENLAYVAGHPEADTVVAGIVGAAGLESSLRAAQTGKKLLLANKEALVMSGQLFMQAVQQHGAVLLPIDSEHNAVFQCLQGNRRQDVRRIWLTASGGPFRLHSAAQLRAVTPAQACAHPNWIMGKKISVDSATMMNKGLEVIEACWLFAAAPEHVHVIVHPQSIIHSLVEYQDGSLLAQMGVPDMRIPIAYALGWPRRIDSGATALDLATLAQLSFEPADTARFPCLGLAYEAIRTGGTAPAILNAANEMAVAAFLHNQLAFTAIATVIERVLSTLSARPAASLATVLEDDAHARMLAQQAIAEQITC